MIPIATLAQMREADALAVARRGQNALVSDAGTAVGLCAQRLLGSCRSRRVAVIVGPGLNGADGRLGARWLTQRGAQVAVIDFDQAPAHLAGYDLVVDAVLGTGASRPYDAPSIEEGTLVLAVDLPSGVDTDTGALVGHPMPASATLALGAAKPAHLMGPSAALVGELHFASLGIALETDSALIVDEDLDHFLSYDVNDHKWVHAITALVGSSLMPGAAELVTRGALAGGASMIRLASRGEVSTQISIPPEVVHVSDASVDARSRAVVAGPGLGSDAPSWLGDALAHAPCPVVLDADGLDRAFIDECARGESTWVLTPHEGEFERLSGRAVSDDRFGDVRRLAAATGCVVLLKGPRTVIAHPGGALRVVTSGTAALATAGSGDVLAGLIAATIARGHDPFEAAAVAAHLHGRAGAALAPYASASEVAETIRAIVAQLPRPSRVR
ncbi:MAG TPA: NAD(P)H-hydrate dehydratase [Acidimicrobiales bacterium]|nr:NAD(P)H-hydrate dehydratase [Acidimicrobiales bacterium]